MRNNLKLGIIGTLIILMSIGCSKESKSLPQIETNRTISPSNHTKGTTSCRLRKRRISFKGSEEIEKEAYRKYSHVFRITGTWSRVKKDFQCLLEGHVEYHEHRVIKGYYNGRPAWHYHDWVGSKINVITTPETPGKLLCVKKLTDVETRALRKRNSFDQ